MSDTTAAELALTVADRLDIDDPGDAAAWTALARLTARTLGTEASHDPDPGGTVSTQTAVVFSVGTGERWTEILVRIYGEHVNPALIGVDSRPMPQSSWRPVDPERIEVRHE